MRNALEKQFRDHLVGNSRPTAFRPSHVQQNADFFSASLERRSLQERPEFRDIRAGCVRADDTIDAGGVRAAMCPDGQRVDGFGCAAGQCFDATVGTVAHPSVKTEPTRFVHERPAKTHALDTALDE